LVVSSYSVEHLKLVSVVSDGGIAKHFDRLPNAITIRPSEASEVMKMEMELVLRNIGNAIG
jgi:hypothetical protein